MELLRVYQIPTVPPQAKDNNHMQKAAHWRVEKRGSSERREGRGGGGGDERERIRVSGGKGEDGKKFRERASSTRYWRHHCTQIRSKASAGWWASMRSHTKEQRCERLLPM